MKLNWGVVAVCLFMGCSGFAQELVSSAPTETREDAGVVDSVYGLEGVFLDNQYRYLPVAPPSEEVFFQSLETIVSVDWKGFPAEFTKQMYAEMSANGFPLYRISVYEDPVSRETVFLNSYGREVYRLAPEKGYDPYAWQKAVFGEESFQTLDELSRWIYDPAHIAVDLVLIPQVFHADYLAMREESAAAERELAASSQTESERVSVGMALVPAVAASSVEEEPMAMAAESSPPPPPTGDGGGDGGGGGGSTSNQAVKLTINLPAGFGTMGHIEIFTKGDLIYSNSWDGADDWVPTLGNQVVEWIDPASTNKSKRYYYIGDGTDSDGDGHSDLYESWVDGSTNTNVFDASDSNTNGINDWWDEKIFGQVSTNQALLDDTDGDGLTNYMEIAVDSMGRVVSMVSDPNLVDSDADTLGDFDERMIWHTEPMKQDTDSDGLKDGEEIGGSPRTDPRNPDRTAPVVDFAGN